MPEPASGNAAKLYTPSVLALSVELAAYPLDTDFPATGYAKSRTCGSEVRVGLEVDDARAVRRIGMAVAACAVGQASAAIFAADVKGRGAEEIRDQMAAMERWIAGEGPAPALPRLELIEPARAYPARHEAILLPWRAALDALSQAGNSG
jgi:NifU-like protein involved in Fe-S cluster formation